MSPAPAGPSTGDVAVAVVGAGSWGRTIAGAIDGTSGISLAGIVSSKPAELASPNRDIPVFGTWRDALDKTGAAGVILAIPPMYQPDMALGLIESGVPAMLEKPLAGSVEQAERLLSEARTHGFTGLVNHLHLHAPEFKELCVRARQLGHIGEIETVSGNNAPFRAGWSPLWDWGPHDLAMSLAVTGSFPATVSARIDERRLLDGQNHRNYRLVLNFENGTEAEILTGNAFSERTRRFSATVNDTRLTYTETAKADRALTVAGPGGTETIETPSMRPLNAALAEFARRIRKGGGMTDMETGAAIVNTLAAADRSVETGRPVMVSGFGAAG